MTKTLNYYNNIVQENEKTGNLILSSIPVRCRLMDKPLWGLRVQAPVERSGSGSGSGPGPGWCLPVFPKGPAPAAQRGIWHPSGLWPSVPRVV